VEPERLGGERDNLGVEVQQHRDVALDPRLVGDVLAGGRRPPQPWEGPLAFVGRE
jgi:hypothetical protein